MASADEREVEAIATALGVDADLLDGVHYDLDTIDGNDGELYGYVVKFADDNEPGVLEKLGLEPGDFTRRLNINVFDDRDYDDDDYDRDLRVREGGENGPLPEPDDGIYSLEDPLPDLSFDEAYLTDDDGAVLTDDRGNPLVVDSSPGALGDGPLNSYDINGPAFAGHSFAGHAFAVGGGSSGEAVQIESLRQEMLSRLDGLEAVIRNALLVPHNRAHNHPPELLNIERSDTQEQLVEVTAAIAEIRREAENPAPDAGLVRARASIFQRFAAFLMSGPGFVVNSMASAIIGDIAVDHFKAHQHQLVDALVQAAGAVIAWAQHLPGLS